MHKHVRAMFASLASEKVSVLTLPREGCEFYSVNRYNQSSLYGNHSDCDVVTSSVQMTRLSIQVIMLPFCARPGRSQRPKEHLMAFRSCVTAFPRCAVNAWNRQLFRQNVFARFKMNFAIFYSEMSGCSRQGAVRNLHLDLMWTQFRVIGVCEKIINTGNTALWHYCWNIVLWWPVEIQWTSKLRMSFSHTRT